MPRSLTLQLSKKKDCIEIIDGISTVRFENGIRGIPFKDPHGEVTEDKSVLFHKLHKPIVDDNGYIHEVFYDQTNGTLSRPLSLEKGNYCLVLIREIVFFRIYPIHGGIIRNEPVAEGKRDVLIMSSHGGSFTLAFSRKQEITAKLIY